LAINTYGATKVAGEALCRALRRERGLQTVVLRLGNIYGPRDVGRVIPTWVASARAGQDLQVYGGKQVIDFTWIGQVVDALFRAAAAEGPLPAINVGSGTGTRIVDLARRIARLADRPGHLALRPARPMEVTRFIAKVDRMRELLGIEPPLDPLAQLPNLFGTHVGAYSP
jgi:UDP-glucose 4-epimerase